MLWVLAIFIGLPLLLVGSILAWGYWADKTTGSMMSSGVTRGYVLYVPKSYQPSQPTPLVISIHPAATWAAFERDVSRWNDLADQYGFIVVYPNGSGVFFGGFSPGAHVWTAEPDTLPRDVKFISDLIDKLESQYNIDPNRIYADGMSNGGGMAFALSCELPNRIAAIGEVSAAHFSWECRIAKPVATIAFHGTADKFAPYRGGPSTIAPRPFANIPDWTAHVAERNQCKGDPNDARVSPNVRRLAYANCADNADVVLYTVEGAGHIWPGGQHLAKWIFGPGTDEISATRLMWEFYMQHPRTAK